MKPVAKSLGAKGRDWTPGPGPRTVLLTPDSKGAYSLPWTGPGKGRPIPVPGPGEESLKVRQGLKAPRPPPAPGPGRRQLLRS